MKYVAILVVLSFAGCMPVPVAFDEKDNVVRIYEGLDSSQKDLYTKANGWMIKAFNDAESVIQHNDKDGGVIMGKYLLFGGVSSGAYGATVDTRVFAIIDIRVKDAKARIEIKPQGSWHYDSSGMTVYTYSREDAIKDMERLAESFHVAMLANNIQF